MARAQQPNGEMKFGRVHLSIQAAGDKRQDLEILPHRKIDGPEQHKQQPDRTVEVYLYLEG